MINILQLLLCCCCRWSHSECCCEQQPAEGGWVSAVGLHGTQQPALHNCLVQGPCLQQGGLLLFKCFGSLRTVLIFAQQIAFTHRRRRQRPLLLIGGRHTRDLAPGWFEEKDEQNNGHFKSSLLLNGLCGIQVYISQTASTTFAFTSVWIFFYA